jgi:hypothetical protein
MTYTPPVTKWAGFYRRRAAGRHLAWRKLAEGNAYDAALDALFTATAGLPAGDLLVSQATNPNERPLTGRNAH